MSNILYPALPVHITSWMFSSLKGLSIPGKSTINSGLVGQFIHNHINSNLNITSNTIVDLAQLGIEVKTKEYSGNTDWSIGSMTLQDILSKPYIQSSVYLKLQALLLVKTDDNFRVIKDIALVYLDCDEVQALVEETYEDLRRQLQERVTNYAINLMNQVKLGNINAILQPITFKPYEQFKGEYGKFEYMDGTSFQFRINQKQMKHLIATANTAQNSLIQFC